MTNDALHGNIIEFGLQRLRSSLLASPGHSTFSVNVNYLFHRTLKSLPLHSEHGSALLPSVNSFLAMALRRKRRNLQSLHMRARAHTHTHTHTHTHIFLLLCLKLGGGAMSNCLPFFSIIFTQYLRSPSDFDNTVILLGNIRYYFFYSSYGLLNGLFHLILTNPLWPTSSFFQKGKLWPRGV